MDPTRLERCMGVNTASSAQALSTGFVSLEAEVPEVLYNGMKEFLGDNPNWEGSKKWSIGGKEILYDKIYLTENYLVEELQITNLEYMPFLIDDEPFGVEGDDE